MLKSAIMLLKLLSRKSTRLSLQALLISMFGLGLAQAIAPAEALLPPEKILLLKQASSYQGVVNTYVSKNAIKICFTNFHGHLIAKAPTWKVAIINEDDKTIFESEFDHWIKHDIARTYLPGKLNEPGNLMRMLDSTSAKYAGKTCRQCTFDAHPFKAKFFGMSRKDITDEKACLIMEKWFATPFVDAIPVAFRYFNPQGVFLSELPKKEKIMMIANYVDPLQCTSIEAIDCPNNFFVYPTNYKKVKDEQAATNSSRGNDMLNDLFDSGIVK